RAVKWLPNPDAPASTTAPVLLPIDPGSIISSAHAINNAGIATGRIGLQLPTRFHDASVERLSSSTGIGAAINDSNSVAGSTDLEPFRYTDAEGFRGLGILPGGVRALGTGIDNQ